MKAPRSRKRSWRSLGPHLLVAGAMIVSVVAFSLAWNRSVPQAEPARPRPADPLRFNDARQQAAEFMSYYRSIPITSQQRAVMDEALTSIPAPCCSKYSIATCCCPCNLAKSVWGLSKLLITEYQFGAPEVKATVRKWIEFTNPDGYSGSACLQRGCERPFEDDGCGGMVEARLQ